MRIQTTSSALFMALAMLPCLHGLAATAQTPAYENAPGFVGVWRGQFDALPGVDLVISNAGHQLHGATLFYLHIRPNVNSPYTSTPGLPEPIFNMRIDGGSFVFQVSHRRAHAPGSLNDPTKTFRLRMTGPNKATLEIESGGAPMVAMRRSDY